MQLFRALIALTVLGTSAPALAEQTPSRNLLPTNLLFSVDGPDLGIFPIVIEEGQNVAISYLHAEGRIELSLGLPQDGRYRNPLFCFNQSETSTSVALETQDPNGYRIFGGIPLDSNLSYILGNGELTYRPAAQVQCFYRGEINNEFGLFGRAPLVSEQVPDGRLFADRFEADERVSIEYNNLAGFRNPGDPLNYQITISNEGTAPLGQVAFQELAPTAAAIFDASVTPATEDFWSCTSSGGATCPGPGTSEDTHSLRFRGLNLPVGSSLTFSVNRLVRSASLTGTLIDFHAGVVAGSGNTAAFDAVHEEVVVIGSADSVFASPAEAAAGQLASIEVTVLDSSLNPVPFVDVNLISADGLIINPSSAQTSDITGYALFAASSTSAGSYAPQFEANGVGIAQASVTVLAAAPDMVNATALIDQAIANGQDQVVMAVLVADAFGNPVPATLVEIMDNGGLTNISSPDPYTDSSGTANFTATSTIADSYSVSFSAASAGPDSATVDFLAGDPAAITFFQQPSDVLAGEIMDPPVLIQILDAENNVVTHDNSSIVQLWLYQDGGVLNFNFANATAINGEIVFDQLSHDIPGTGYSLWAQAALAGNAADNEMSSPFQVLTTAP